MEPGFWISALDATEPMRDKFTCLQFNLFNQRERELQCCIWLQVFKWVWKNIFAIFIRLYISNYIWNVGWFPCERLINQGCVHYALMQFFLALDHRKNQTIRTRGSQRNVVYLGWPIAPSYVSSNAGGGELRGLRHWVQLYTWSPTKLWRSNFIFDNGKNQRHWSPKKCFSRFLERNSGSILLRHLRHICRERISARHSDGPIEWIYFKSDQSCWTVPLKSAKWKHH